MNEPGVVEEVFTDLLKLFNEKKLKSVIYQPVTHGIENSVQAIKDIASRKTYGKVVVSLPARNSKL